jgi:hypothetical protein
MNNNAIVVVRTNEQADPSLIVFGRDGAGKPRASWFDNESAELASKAAGLMKMRVLKVETDEQKEVARQLAPGRVFASGRAFTPFARASVFTKLVELARGGNGHGSDAPSTGVGADENAADGAAAAGTSASSGSAVPDAPKRPEDWDEIGIGSLVLATVGVKDGWWESIVIGVNGDSFTLKWRDFPRDPVFVRSRTEVALLPTGAP